MTTETTEAATDAATEAATDELDAVRAELERVEREEREAEAEAEAKALAVAAKAGRARRPAAPRGWKPGARGHRDIAGPDGGPLFSADELAAMEAPIEAVPHEARKARKRLLNRYSEARIRADERARIEAAERDARAVAAAVAEAPVRPLTGGEFLDSWDAVVEVLDHLRVLPVVELAGTSTRWTADERRAVEPEMLRAYDRWPALREGARAVAGPEVRLALVLLPAAAAKVAILYQLARMRIAGSSCEDLRAAVAAGAAPTATETAAPPAP